MFCALCGGENLIIGQIVTPYHLGHKKIPLAFYGDRGILELLNSMSNTTPTDSPVNPRLEQSVTKQTALGTEEILIQEVSVQDTEDRKVEQNNAELVWTPSFIPFYPKLTRTHNLTTIESLVYGYVHHLTAGGDNPFCVVNFRMAYTLGCSERSITDAFKSLKDKGLISLFFRKQPNGNMIREVRVMGGVAGIARGVENSARGVAQIASNKNYNKNSNIKKNFVQERKPIPVDITPSKLEEMKKTLDNTPNLSIEDFEEAKRKLSGKIGFRPKK